MGLNCEFCDDAAKQPQWQALLHEGRIDAGTLAETVDLFHSLSWLASQVVAKRQPLHRDMGRPTTAAGLRFAALRDYLRCAT